MNVSTFPHEPNIILESAPCGICGGNEFRDLYFARDYIYGINGEWPVVQCTNCCVVLLNPRIPPALIGQFYPKDYYTNMPHSETTAINWRRVAKDIVLKHYFGYSLSDHYPLRYNLFGWLIFPYTSRSVETHRYIYPVKSGRVLDIGCGNGKILNEYARLGWETYGIEINPSAAEYAQQAGHKVFIGELPDANYPNDRFSAVTLWDTLEHIHNPGEIICEIYRILQPGGRVYTSVPNYDSWYRRKYQDRWFMFTAPLHYYHYTQATLTTLFTQSGFQNIQISFPLGAAGLYATLKYLWRERKILSKTLDALFINKLLAGIDLLTPRGHLLSIAQKV